VPPLVLTILKFLFLALLYLFIARAVRVIYLDIAGTRVPRAQAPAASQPAPRRKPRARPRSLVVTEGDEPARTYPMEEEPISIGRADACKVILGDTYVSQVHARVFPKDGEWFVEDLGSTNGTYLNRVKVSAPSQVGVGDEIRIGKTTLEVQR
jgi:pSer/pThr/pTyr-binding forkhead associated (FHA) protein